MNRTETIKAVAQATGKTQKEIAEVMDALNTVVVENAAEGVQIIPGVTIMSVHKDACEKRNPATGAMVKVDPKEAPKAKFGKAFKDAINA